MRDFEAHYLPTWLINQIVLKREQGDNPFPWAQTWLKSALSVRPARTAYVHTLMEHTVAELAAHAHAAYGGRLSQPKFSQLALGTLFDGAVRAYLAGARQHDPAFGISTVVRDKLTQRVSQQAVWLADLYDSAQELGTLDKALATAWLNDNARMSQRIALYAGTLHGAHQQGEVDGWISAHGEEPVIVWHAVGDPPCLNCAVRDGQEFRRDTLPDFPADGLFGSFSCLGGPNCRCYLTLEPSGIPLREPELPPVEAIPAVPIP